MNAGLTLEAIAEAAVRTGFRDLSLSGVARSLGVTHVALYRYVKDRAALGFVAVERVAADLPWPNAEDGWERHLLDVAHLVNDTFQDHPGLYEEVVRLGSVPSFDRHTIATANVLVGHGFTPDQTRLAVEVLFNLVLDTFRTNRGVTDAAQDPNIPEPFRSTSVTLDDKLDLLIAGLKAVLGRS
ncbi:MAG: TetR/AcrR family transcriptional regulator [Actinomycetota bacterium]